MEISLDQMPKVDVTIAEDRLFEGASEILKAIRPSWKAEDVTFKMLTDGITNKLVKCSSKDLPDEESVLVRVYGNKTDLLIDRSAETRNIVLLNKVGLAPQLYATFDNGLAYEFVPGCTLTDRTVTAPEIYSLVARHMARLHGVQVSDGTMKQPMLWKKLNDFLNLVPDKFADEDKQTRYERIGPSKVKIKGEIEALRPKLELLGSPIVFAHNDLLLGNVIYTASKDSVTFIDFEYATFNYQAFDIGNHFNEFVGIDNIDYKKYPSKEFQYAWLREYLSVSNDNVSNRELDRLYVQVNQFALVSHIFWGIWALIQAEHSYIDFDFMGYANIRFDEYFARKDEFLSLELPR